MAKDDVDHGMYYTMYYIMYLVRCSAQNIKYLGSGLMLTRISVQNINSHYGLPPVNEIIREGFSILKEFNEFVFRFRGVLWCVCGKPRPIYEV